MEIQLALTPCLVHGLLSVNVAAAKILVSAIHCKPICLLRSLALAIKAFKVSKLH